MRLQRTPLLLACCTSLATTSLAQFPTPDSVSLARRSLLLSANRAVQDGYNTLAATQDECDFTSSLATLATLVGHRGTLGLRVASCINEESSNPQDYIACLQQAFAEFNENVEEAHEQHDARIDLCLQTGGGIYDPDLEEDDFLVGVSHPYLPFLSGGVWVYQQQTSDGLEEITITVESGTKEIDDIECIIVHDVVTLDGVLIEDTLDWYAQHEDGTVWYMGEIARNYEDGELVDLDGSWLAGEEGAQPGIVMLAQPLAGQTYRQELLLTEAEDAAKVLATDVEVTIGLGTFTNCLVTEDFTPLEPGHIEHKYYAPGVGLVLETKPGSSERLELVSFTPGS